MKFSVVSNELAGDLGFSWHPLIGLDMLYHII